MERGVAPARGPRRNGKRGVVALAVAAILASCGDEAPPPAPVRPVRTVVIEPETTANTYTASGEIRARYETPVAFRLSGTIIARNIDVGSVVKAGDQIAVLDDRDQRNAVESAKSDVFSATSTLTQVRAQEARFRELLRNGYTPQARYDEALRDLRGAEAKLQAANAALRAATDQLSYTVLTAPRDGVITAVGASAGQVVGAGQMVAELADPSEREALFNIAESWLRDPRSKDPVVDVSLLGDPSINTVGRVREISPTADPVTRTYAVRVSLPDAPPAMRLGASVTGQVTIAHPTAVAVLPATALFQKDAKPAVWVVDRGSSTVALREVAVEDYETDKIVIESGLEKGDVVVTAGVQLLSPGEKVRLSGGS